MSLLDFRLCECVATSFTVLGICDERVTELSSVECYTLAGIALASHFCISSGEASLPMLSKNLSSLMEGE